MTQMVASLDNKNTSVFLSPPADQFHTWNVPQAAMFVYGLVVGSGGNGGTGFGAASGNRGGGGGGGGGFIVSFVMPTWGFHGSSLQIIMRSAATQIQTAASTVTGSGYLIASAANGKAGGNGTASAAGTGGSAQTVAFPGQGQTNRPYTFGAYSFGQGVAGASGGAHTGGNGVSLATRYTNALPRMSGGAGGGGVNAADTSGGTVGTGGTIMPVTIGAGGSSAFGLILGQSAELNALFGGVGGGGGNGYAAAPGQAGGNGGYGCGGGGGGAGTTGGAGGKGGPGFAVLSWI